MMRLALALGLLALACGGSESDPSSLINQPRLLAMRSTPPVLGLADTAQLDALVIDARGNQVQAPITWRACDPWTFILDPDEDCGPDQSVILDGTVSAAQIVGRFPPPADEGVPPGEPDPCETTTAQVALPLIAEAVVDGERLVARKDIPFSLSTAPTANPIIGGVWFDGEQDPVQFEHGREYALSFGPQSAAPSECEDEGPASLDINLYVTAGRLDDGRVDATEIAIWSAPADGDATIWLVATDAVGGVDWTSRELVGK